MDFLIDMFLPRRCLYCLGLLPQGVFCSACEGMIKSVKPEPGSQPVNAAFIYGGIIRDLILRAKFHPNESTGRSLARYLNDFLKEPSEAKTSILDARVDFISYVPSHWKRRLTRGYELPALFAAAIGKQMALPLRHVLSCVRNDPPLSSTPSAKERKIQVENRYRIACKTLHASSILLVDDIITTGATMSASKQVLESAGHRVQCFAFAKTESTTSSR